MLVVKIPGIPSYLLVVPGFHSTKTFFVGEAKWAGGSMSLWDGASVPECTGGHGGNIFAWLHVIVFGSADMMLHASLPETSLRGMK